MSSAIPYKWRRKAWMDVDNSTSAALPPGPSEPSPDSTTKSLPAHNVPLKFNRARIERLVAERREMTSSTSKAETQVERLSIRIPPRPTTHTTHLEDASNTQSAPSVSPEEIQEAVNMMTSLGKAVDALLEAKKKDRDVPSGKENTGHPSAKRPKKNLPAPSQLRRSARVRKPVRR